jgi:hypothetical protein
MNWLIQFIRKLFLVKEIVSKEGVVHFRRYRLLSTPWFNIYVHNILASDEDRDPHDHPWSFIAFMFWGSYLEEWLGAYEDWSYWNPPKGFGHDLRKSIRQMGSLYYHNAKDFHKITLRTPSVWTLVFASGRKRPGWGYQTRQGWIQFQEYRQLKNQNKLPKE